MALVARSLTPSAAADATYLSRVTSIVDNDTQVLFDGLAKLAADAPASHRPVLISLCQAVQSRRADLRGSALGPAFLTHCMCLLESYGACLRRGEDAVPELQAVAELAQLAAAAGQWGAGPQEALQLLPGLMQLLLRLMELEHRKGLEAIKGGSAEAAEEAGHWGNERVRRDIELRSGVLPFATSCYSFMVGHLLPSIHRTSTAADLATLQAFAGALAAASRCPTPAEALDIIAARSASCLRVVFAAHLKYLQASCAPVLARTLVLLERWRQLPLHFTLPLKATFDCTEELLALAARCNKFGTLQTGFGIFGSAGPVSTAFITEQLSALLIALAPAAVALKLTAAAASPQLPDEVRHAMQAYTNNSLLRSKQDAEGATDRLVRGQQTVEHAAERLLRGQEAADQQQQEQNQRLERLESMMAGIATSLGRGGAIPSPFTENQGAAANQPRPDSDSAAASPHKPFPGFPALR